MTTPMPTPVPIDNPTHSAFLHDLQIVREHCENLLKLVESLCVKVHTASSLCLHNDVSVSPRGICTCNLCGVVLQLKMKQQYNDTTAQ